MVHRVQNVKAKDNYIIEPVFLNGEIVQYDVKQSWVLFPQFKVFETDQELYKSVKVDQSGYGISWNDELELDAESIWENGVLIETEKYPDINRLLAYRLLMAREKANMTQKELAQKTGVASIHTGSVYYRFLVSRMFSIAGSWNGDAN